MMTPANRSYRCWFWIAALLGLAVDLTTKQIAFTQLAPGEEGRIEVITGFFSLVRQPGLNRGALFGFGNTEETGWIANLIFASISSLAVIIIGVWSFRASVARDRLLCLALGLILGGAAGNLFDRMVHGGVRDFLWVYYQKQPGGELSFNWPVFNIADACLVIGAALLILQAFFTKPAKEEAMAKAPQPAATP